MSLILKESKRRFSILFVIVAVLLFSVGLYISLLAVSPYLYLHQKAILGESTTFDTTAVAAKEDRLYIPRLNIDIAYKSGDASVLNDAAWHRYAERGDPEKGGNFILAGHRFELAPTPLETHRKSPFFNIDQIKEGDEIYVDYQSKRYAYSVKRHFTASPNQIEIEATSEEPKMTLYTCTLRGSSDGREVIEATPVSMQPAL